MKTWFTADTHLGHANIIKYAHRPFADVKEMDETIIARWNERVGDDDTVFFLGDFAFKHPGLYFPKLKGQKHLILGNHDPQTLIREKWMSVSVMREISIAGVPITLCHYGMRVWNKSHHGALHFYGHSHGSLPGDSQSCDVGVDCWDFRPVRLEEIQERLKTLPQRGAPDHHGRN